MKSTKKAVIAAAAGVALVLAGTVPAHAYGEKVWNEPRACGANWVATYLVSSGDQLQVIYSGSTSQRRSYAWTSTERANTFRSSYLNSTAASVSTSNSISISQYGCGF